MRGVRRQVREGGKEGQRRRERGEGEMVGKEGRRKRVKS